MENYDIFYMLPNLKCNFLIPLLTEQFFFTYSTYKAPPNLQLGLSSKGGCDIGEALAVEGEVQEKSAPSSPMGEEGVEQTHGPHSYTPSSYIHSFSLSSSNLGNNDALEILRLHFPRHTMLVSFTLPKFILQFCARIRYGGMCLDVVAGGSQKDELGATLLTP